MTDLTIWFVRHTPTGNFLPEPAGRMGRGGSHVEPTPADELPPRQFRSRIAASRALSSWLRGKVHHSSGYDSFSMEYWENLDLEPVPSRKREEMEIVSVTVPLP